MKLISFVDDGRRGWGALDGELVTELSSVLSQYPDLVHFVSSQHFDLRDDLLMCRIPKPRRDVSALNVSPPVESKRKIIPWLLEAERVSDRHRLAASYPQSELIGHNGVVPLYAEECILRIDAAIIVRVDLPLNSFVADLCGVAGLTILGSVIECGDRSSCDERPESRIVAASGPSLATLDDFDELDELTFRIFLGEAPVASETVPFSLNALRTAAETVLMREALSPGDMVTVAGFTHQISLPRQATEMVTYAIDGIGQLSLTLLRN